jgi:predicted dehydrogenase
MAAASCQPPPAAAVTVPTCVHRASRAEARATEFGIARWSTDLGALLDEVRPDAVDIATTVSSHRELVEQCAARRLPAICQKPFARSLPEARAMVAAMRAAGASLTVHENFRFQRAMRLAASRQRGLGEPFFARISFRSRHDIVSAQPYLAADERFIIADLGVHLLDLARCFLGEVSSVACVTRRIDPRVRGEDAAVILLRHRSGAASAVDLSYASHVPEELFPQTLVELECASGSVRVEPRFQVVTVRDSTVTRETAAPEPRPWHAPPGAVVQDSVLSLQRHWLERHLAGERAETDAADHLRTLALVESAYAAAASGSIVTPETV